MSRRRRRGPPRKRRRNYKREYEMSKNPIKEPVGAPIGSQNGLSHGIVAFKNQVKRRVRRGRSLIDHRTVAGQNAIGLMQELTNDLGGADNLSAAQLTLIELIGRGAYLTDECDRRIFTAIRKINEREKALLQAGKFKNPKVIAVLYGYRQGMARDLVNNLQLLGLEKAPPKQKTLQEILEESEEEKQEAE
jgi:hypothetical protein